MTPPKRKYFTPDDFKRLARNPFVDKKMLQFVKNKTIGPSADPVSAHAVTGAASSVQTSGTSRVNLTRCQPVMSEKTALLIATAIKGMLRE